MIGMSEKSRATSISRGTRRSRSLEIAPPGAFTAVGFSGHRKNPGASAAERGRLSVFKSIDEDRRARHDHINRSAKSTYPEEKAVQTSGATPELEVKDVTWINASGAEMQQSEWNDGLMRCFGMLNTAT